MTQDISALRRRLDEQDFQIAELHRKVAGVVQVGTVTSFDPVKGAVLDLGYATHPVAYAWHAGTGADWAPLKVGQQVTMLCPSGDASNGFVLPGGFHSANPAPSQSAAEDIRAQRGTASQPNRLRTSDSGAYLEALGNAIAIEDGKVTLTAAKIILAGACYLGGSDAALPAAMQGSTDSAGYAEVGNLATQVFVK
jgi:phage baseplate assembly protein gpV